MVEAVLSLGSNLGEREVQLQQAIKALRAIDIGLRHSSLYSSPALGYDGKDFLNQVVILRTRLDVFSLLSYVQSIEWAGGRSRDERQRGYRDRLIDIDIIDYHGMHFDEEQLQLPHPRAHERAFVLRPWLEICGDRVFPSRQENLSDLLETSADRESLNILAP